MFLCICQSCGTFMESYTPTSRAANFTELELKSIDYSSPGYDTEEDNWVCCLCYTNEFIREIENKKDITGDNMKKEEFSETFRVTTMWKIRGRGSWMVLDHKKSTKHFFNRKVDATAFAKEKGLNAPVKKDKER